MILPVENLKIMLSVVNDRAYFSNSNYRYRIKKDRLKVKNIDTRESMTLVNINNIDRIIINENSFTITDNEIDLELIIDETGYCYDPPISSFFLLEEEVEIKQV